MNEHYHVSTYCPGHNVPSIVTEDAEKAHEMFYKNQQLIEDLTGSVITHNGASMVTYANCAYVRIRECSQKKHLL